MKNAHSAIWVFGFVLGLLPGCSGRDDDDAPGSGGSSGSATGGTGTGGSAGTGGTNAGGSAGSSTGGQAGAGGAPPIDCSGSTSTDATFQKAIGALKDYLTKSGTPGGAIAVIKDGKIQVGVAGSKRASVCEPITENTMFRAGLISTIVTTAGVLDAVEDKKLGLQSPMTDVLPTFKSTKNVPADVKLAHLLSQTSGYPGFALGLPCTDLTSAVLDSPPLPLWAPPGAVFQWDPGNFAIAGLMLEKADQKPFADAIRARVLDKLGMGGTFEPVIAAKGDHSWGHQKGPVEQDITAIDCGYQHPSTQYHATIHDVAKLAEMFIDGGKGVLDPATIADLMSKHAAGTYQPNYVGYGFERNDDFGIAWSGGVSAGFSTELEIYPSRKFAVIVLLNLATADPTAVTDPVARLYYDDLPPFPVQAYTPDTQTFPSLVGEYYDNLGKRTLQVESDGTKLYATLVEAGEKSELTGFFSADSFQGKFFGKSPLFRFWRDGADQGAIITQGYAQGAPFFRTSP